MRFNNLSPATAHLLNIPLTLFTRVLIFPGFFCFLGSGFLTGADEGDGDGEGLGEGAAMLALAD